MGKMFSSSHLKSVRCHLEVMCSATITCMQSSVYVTSH